MAQFIENAKLLRSCAGYPVSFNNDAVSDMFEEPQHDPVLTISFVIVSV